MISVDRRMCLDLNVMKVSAIIMCIVYFNTFRSCIVFTNVLLYLCFDLTVMCLNCVLFIIILLVKMFVLH